MSKRGGDLKINAQAIILTAIGLILLTVAAWAGNTAWVNSKDIAVNQTKIESIEKGLDRMAGTLDKIWERMTGQ